MQDGRVPSEVILTQKERPTPVVDGMVSDAEEMRGNGGGILLFATWLLCTVTSCLRLRLTPSASQLAAGQLMSQNLARLPPLPGRLLKLRVFEVSMQLLD